MATRTANAAQAVIQPKGLRVGLVAVSAVWSIDAGMSLSPGDVIQMVKVPANAQVVYLQVASTYSGDAGFTVGDGITDNRYILLRSASVGMGAVTMTSRYIPYTYSTDDTIDIDITAVSISTIGGMFSLVAIYSMDPDPH